MKLKKQKAQKKAFLFKIKQKKQNEKKMIRMLHKNKKRILAKTTKCINYIEVYSIIW